MLPARHSERLRLADLLPACLTAIVDGTGPLAALPVRKAVVVVIDGLGAEALRARAGHARTLSRAPRLERAESGFPTTTAAALASLTTGSPAGQHGMVGYRVLDPQHDRMLNQLNDLDQVDPSTWQRRSTVFAAASGHRVAPFAIGARKFASSAFTRAVLRGAQYVASDSLRGRFDAARELFDRHDRALVYLYIPELDQLGHSSGWESSAWLEQLEAVDAELDGFSRLLRADEGMLVTADHGMIDVPAASHVLFDAEAALVDGVRHVGGEPRCLQLYLEPWEDPTAVAERWRNAEGDRAWVVTREEIVQAGWFGETDAEVLPRIGDVLVAARKRVAYYDSRDERSMRGRSMIGQHGSLTKEELEVPLARFGAFAG